MDPVEQHKHLLAQLIDERKRREDYEFLLSIKDKEITGLTLNVESMKDDITHKDL